MAGTDIIWLTIDADRPEIDIKVNDVPVARLQGNAARRVPINEFVHPRHNTIAVTMSPAYQAHGHFPPGGGSIGLTISHAHWVDDDKTGEETLLNISVPYPIDAVRPGALLCDASFTGPLSLPRDPSPMFGTADPATVLRDLARVAQWWQAPAHGALIDWLDGYVRDFVRAYSTENLEDYRADMRGMVERYGGGTVHFNPATTVLVPCGNGQLFDCRSHDGGPAIVITRDDGDSYDFWMVVGVRDGSTVLVR